MSEGKVQTLAEVPFDAFQEAITKTETVSIRVTRRNAKGQLQVIPGWINAPFPTTELMNIEGLLKEQAGGGNFRVEVRDPKNAGQYIMPPFFVNIEGLPKAVAAVDYGPQPVYPQGPSQMPFQQQQGQPVAMTPQQTGWGAGLPLAAQQHYFGSMQQQPYHEAPPAPGASMPSDQMALRQIGDLKAELAGLKKERDQLTSKLEDQRDTYEEKLGKLRDQLSKMETDRLEAKRTHEMDLMRLEMRNQQAVSEARMQAASAPRSTAMQDFAPVLSAIVPAWLDSSSKQQAAQMASQSAMMTAMMGRKQDSGLGEVMPLLVEMQRAKSPEAQAAILDQLMESQMRGMGMQAQIIEMMLQSKGEEGSPWAMALQQLVGEGMGMFGAYIEAKKKEAAARMTAGAPTLVRPGLPPTTLQPQHTPPQQPAQRPQAPAGPFPPGASYVQTQGETTATTQKPAATNGSNGHGTPKPAPMPPDQIVKLIVASPKVPNDFKTPEWQDILLRIHRRDPIEQVSTALLQHLDKLFGANALPQDLVRIAEDPAGVITDLIVNLPISQYDSDYAVSLRNFVVAKLMEILNPPAQQPPVASADSTEDESEDEPADDESDEEEPEAPPAVIDSLALSPGRRR